MAPQRSGKGPATEGDASTGPSPKGSWEGSWVMERKIEVMRRARRIPAKELVSCCPSKGERVPTVVVF
jgi:hypothetical protein